MSTMAPRAVLMRIASRFICASVAALIISRVSSVSGQCRLTTSLTASRSFEALDAIDADGDLGAARHIRVIGDDAHAERLGADGGGDADAPEADDAEASVRAGAGRAARARSRSRSAGSATRF